MSESKNETQQGHPIHPVIAIIGKAIAIYLQFGKSISDDEMLLEYIEHQVKLYKTGR